jgi:RecJ-like exonuclease
MKTKFTKECNTCCGSGTVTLNDSWDEHPSRDYSITCDDCQGEGECIDQEAIIQVECRIEDVEYMIDGMLTRIRLTSDTLKDLSKGMFYELLPKYKNTLNTQARGLARLESYLVNLKNQLA